MSKFTPGISAIFMMTLLAIAPVAGGDMLAHYGYGSTDIDLSGSFKMEDRHSMQEPAISSVSDGDESLLPPADEILRTFAEKIIVIPQDDAFTHDWDDEDVDELSDYLLRFNSGLELKRPAIFLIAREDGVYLVIASLRNGTYITKKIAPSIAIFAARMYRQLSDTPFPEQPLLQLSLLPFSTAQGEVVSLILWSIETRKKTFRIAESVASHSSKPSQYRYPFGSWVRAGLQAMFRGGGRAHSSTAGNRPLFPEAGEHVVPAVSGDMTLLQLKHQIQGKFRELQKGLKRVLTPREMLVLRMQIKDLRLDERLSMHERKLSEIEAEGRPESVAYVAGQKRFLAALSAIQIYAGIVAPQSLSELKEYLKECYEEIDYYSLWSILDYWYQQGRILETHDSGKTLEVSGITLKEWLDIACEILSRSDPDIHNVRELKTHSDTWLNYLHEYFEAISLHPNECPCIRKAMALNDYRVRHSRR